jgi:hypothetical protein
MTSPNAGMLISEDDFFSNTACKIYLDPVQQAFFGIVDLMWKSKSGCDSCLLPYF